MRHLSTALGGLGLCAVLGLPGQPPTLAAEPAAREAQAISRFVGVWALTDSRNNLFNVRVYADGKAVSTVGTAGVPNAGSTQLRDAEFRELGQWSSWGNGIRVDYSDGWSDWIYVSPSGLSHSAWSPGQSRSEQPSNFGTAVKLQGAAADAVGVYSFPPAQPGLPPYTAALLSNGLAFNSIDSQSGGVWHLNGDTVVIQWISGWRTDMSLAPSNRLELRHWAPGANRQGPPTAVRQAQVIE